MSKVAVIVVDLAELTSDEARRLGASASFVAFGGSDLSLWMVAKDRFGRTGKMLTVQMLQRVSDHIAATRLMMTDLPGESPHRAAEMIVGTGVFVIKRTSEGLKFLLGKRTTTCRRGAGCWALPGGICEMHETVSECVHREVMEETGLLVRAISPHRMNDSYPACLPDQVPCLAVTDHRPREPHVSFWMLAEYLGGVPTVAEPDKCERWEWVDLPWVEDNVLGVNDGEQAYWTPLPLWKQILPPLGF